MNETDTTIRYAKPRYAITAASALAMLADCSEMAIPPESNRYELIELPPAKPLAERKRELQRRLNAKRRK